LIDPSQAHSMNTEEILNSFGVDPEKGMDPETADEKLKLYGPNQLDPEVPDPWWKNLLGQFMTPMIYLLSGASFISLVMKETLDAAAILVVILLNAFIGFVTESRAEKALLALRSMISPTAVVLRGGIVFNINAATLVPGDIVILEAGDVVPADARVITQYNLGIDEAALTGESLPVDKTAEKIHPETELADRRNCLFSGTAVVRGSGRAVVFATGMNTEIGRISSLLSTVEQSTTPLEERLARLSTLLIRMVIGIAVLVTGIGVLQGEGGECE